MNNIANEPEYINNMAIDEEVRELKQKLYIAVAKYRYTYNFNWLGRPIIQMPQDIVAMQELIWQVRPDLIIECGIAHGGSIIFYASMLELLGTDGYVIGIDIEIREHNKQALISHPFYHRLKMINGSSVDIEVAEEICHLAEDREKVMVVLDSNHTHDHVLKELELYSPLVTKGSYIVVFDTLIDDMPEDTYPNRPWGKGNNPKTAVREFLKNTDRFEIDSEFEKKLLFTVAPEGYLKCIKD